MWRHEHKPQEPQRWLQERDTEWLAPTNAHHAHCAPRQLGTTVNWRYDVPWDWLWVACQLAGERWGTRCEGFCSKEGPHYCFEQSARNPLERDQVQIVLGNHPEAVIGQGTINLLIHKFGNPVRIPYPNGTALLSGAYVMQESWAQGFVWVRKVWFTFAQQTFAPETFGKRQKGERSLVVSATRFPRASCFKKPLRSVPETWGRLYDVLPWSPKGPRKRDKKLDSCAAKKGAKKLLSCNFVKILE